MSKLKRVVEETRDNGGLEMDAVDKGIVNFTDVPGICKYKWFIQCLLETTNPHNSSYNNCNPGGPVGLPQGPQDAQRRVAIIVTNTTAQAKWTVSRSEGSVSPKH